MGRGAHRSGPEVGPRAIGPHFSIHRISEGGALDQPSSPGLSSTGIGCTNTMLPWDVAFLAPLGTPTAEPQWSQEVPSFVGRIAKGGHAAGAVLGGGVVVAPFTILSSTDCECSAIVMRSLTARCYPLPRGSNVRRSGAVSWAARIANSAGSLAQSRADAVKQQSNHDLPREVRREAPSRQRRSPARPMPAPARPRGSG